jgi:hypothetical protein
MHEDFANKVQAEFEKMLLVAAGDFVEPQHST